MASFISSIISYPVSLFNKYFLDNKHLSEQRPNLEEFFIHDESFCKDRKEFDGVITSLHNGEGVINNEIYFSVNSEVKLDFKVGDRVQGESIRQSDNSAWRAVKFFSATEDWESIKKKINDLDVEVQPSSNEQTIVGKVTNVYQNLICLNTQVSFYNDGCSDFDLCVGDWIQCERDDTSVYDSESSILKMKKVSPLRRKFIHGIISYINRTYYVINGEVYCQKYLFSNHFLCKEKVIAEVIESDQLKYSWRAINLKKNQTNSTNVSQSNARFVELMNYNAEKNQNEVLSQVNLDLINMNVNFEDILVEGNCNVSLNGVGYTEFLKLNVRNRSKINDYMIENIMILSTRTTEKQLSLDKSLKFPVKLLASNEYPIILLCIGKVVGSSSEIIIFKLTNGLAIKKQINLKIQGPFQQKREAVKYLNINNCRMIKGEKPVYSSPFLPIKLPRAEIPDQLWDTVLNNESLIYNIPSLQESLNIDNYATRFSSLLFLEEIEMNMQMRRFDIECTSFSRHGEYLSLFVEGLSESRPSLLVGDSVIASTLNSIDDVKYEGIIHEVLHSKVLLKFNPNFQLAYNGEDYSVQLCFNRTPFRRCHQAVSLATTQLGELILFPSKLHFSEPQIKFMDLDINANQCNQIGNNSKREDGAKIAMVKKGTAHHTKSNSNLALEEAYPGKNPNGPTVKEAPILQWFNKELNTEQKTAVKRILEGSTRPLPYIIFGPPGTGKTVTLVEALLQIYKMIPHSRILVVSPSNSASDLVAERAINSSDLKPGELIRINAFNRCERNISSRLERYCTNGSDLKHIVRHRVIVSTAVTAGLLYTTRIKNDHFTHILIDEAGQLTEPETLIAMNFVNKNGGQIVLAGDPKQLGPVISSSLAKKFGLNQSLLHRLCNSVIYQPQNPQLRSVYSENFSSESPTAENIVADYESYFDHFDPKLVTLLVKNYRSHSDLVHVSSRLFYNSLLVPAQQNHKEKEHFLKWKELPNPSCPLIFHPIIGENLQEGDSPSWFNPAEVYQVSHYVLSLLKFGVKPCDIGIIAPYKKQVEKIRRLLVSFGVEEGVKIGPVEEFQGQEKLAVILSTVRSSENLLEDDVCHNLGFVRCAQRFNVAITRAVALLIVVGNPFLLSQDSNWNEFLNYCLDKQAIKKS